MTSFTDYIASDRQNAFNALRAKTEPKQVYVYVEDTDDVAFWHGILNPYEQQAAIKFRITAYSGSIATGKGNLEKLFPNTGEFLIICLDSDYDYLLPENSDIAKKINKNPYVFQTYSYAMENLKCYAESLNNLCITATQNCTDDIIDFPYFLSEYSKIIHPLFILELYFFHTKKQHQRSILDFKNTVTIGNLTPDNHQDLLNKLKDSVTKKLQQLEIDTNILEFSKQIPELTESTTYLFINGHSLYSTVLHLLKEVCDKLQQKHIQEIKKLAQTPNKNSSETIKHYINSSHSVETLLATNDKFKQCFLFEKIIADIKNYLAIINTFANRRG